MIGTAQVPISTTNSVLVLWILTEAIMAFGLTHGGFTSPEIHKQCVEESSEPHLRIPQGPENIT